MCGIAGIAGDHLPRLDAGDAAAVAAALRKRGPDDWGYERFRRCFLVHTRLAILDLEGGRQPMRDADGGLSIVFNGEIYNFRELKADLHARGYVFTTNSDTEVILKAYLEFGVDAPKYLDGMFAFAIWNDREGSLYLARDRFGKKPLYYSVDGNGNLAFASETKALFSLGGITGELDVDALDAFLRVLYIPPRRTVYKNVEVLKPAHWLLLKREKRIEGSYWQLEDKPVRISYHEAKEAVRMLLRDAVRKRMIADVEIGSLLSGGVDSTLVTAYAQAASSTALKTFSVGYGRHIDELPFALEAAKTIGTDHHTITVDGEHLVRSLEDVCGYFDEPHADSSDIAHSLVCELARTRVKVVLSGDGGDELFVGYPWYWAHKALGWRDRWRQRLYGTRFSDYIRNLEIFKTTERTLLLGCLDRHDMGLVPPEVEALSSGGIKKMNLYDLLVYLPGQLLAKADRAGMMHSVEIRSPLLDHALAEFVFNLPMSFKTKKREGKLVLKDLLAEIMPREFVHRRKQGFGAPVRAWLKSSFEGCVKDLLYSRSAPLYNWLDRRAVESVVSGFYTGANDSYWKVWALLCLEMWLRQHPSGAGTRLGERTYGVTSLTGGCIASRALEARRLSSEA